MSDQFVGEIRIMSFGFPPKGWAQCNGQILQISTNAALFSLLGTAYGGDGKTTFGLPDMRSRVPVHPGGSVGGSVGSIGGEEAHTLTIPEMPAHQHTLTASSSTASTSSPDGAYLAAASSAFYSPSAPTTSLAPAAVGNAGGSQSHENRAPLLALQFCIALTGIYPSRS